MLTVKQLAISLMALLTITHSWADPSQNAKDNYQVYCSGCHGTDLTGGSSAPSLVDSVWQYGSTDSNISRNIRHGIGAAGMPAFGELFSRSELKQMVKYIRTSANKASEKATLPETLHTREYDVKVENWLPGGIETPWSIAFIDKDTALLTEKIGRLRLINNNILEPQAIRGTPKVYTEGQAGLLDVAVDPNYEKNGWIYLAYSHELPSQKNQAMTRIVRGKIKNLTWVDQQIIFSSKDNQYITSRAHYGSRIAFGADKTLYFSIGDRGKQNDAQDVTKPNGKIHRINRDGSIPEDNPDLGKNAVASIYTFGNRNPQGLTIHPQTKEIWSSEHGPMGGDEINLIQSGKNYGWPKFTYGINYSGTIISEDFKGPDIESPVHYWAPSIAVSGIDFYHSGPFERWHNNLLVGGLALQVLERHVVENNRIIHKEVLLKNHGRVRDVVTSPDGAIYVVQNNPNRVLKLTMDKRVVRQ